MAPVQAAQAYAAGDTSALRYIPLTTAPDQYRCLRDMDGLPFVPCSTWSGHYVGVWRAAGLLEIDVDASRFRLTDAGRRAVA